MERIRARGDWKRWLFLAGLIFVSVLGWHFGFGKLIALARGADPVALAWMALWILAGFLIRAWKWHRALGPGSRGVFLFFLAKTAGNWTPGRAGELAPLLLKEHQNARVAAWIGLDRAVEVAFTLLMGVAGVASLGLLGPGGWRGGIGGLLLLLVLGVCLWRVAPHLAARVRGGILARAVHIVRRLVEEAWLLRHALPMAALLTFFAKLTDIYAVILLCRAFGYDADFLLVCAARCAHGLVSAIPFTPDATGVPFVAAAWLLHEHAEIPYDVLTAALALEVIAINAILWICFCIASLRRGGVNNGGNPLS